MNRKTTLAAATAAAALALPGAAPAHVTAYPPEVPADGYGKVDFRVPHGCDGSPTRAITVKMPDQVVSATPQVVEGWDIDIEEGKLPTPHKDAHTGDEITEGVREVSWSGGNLKDGYLQEFGLSIQVKGGKAGETAYFKVLQKCAKGETAWAEIPVDGEEEPEAPAAEVTFVPSDEHGATSSKPSGQGGEDVAQVDARQAAVTGASDDEDGPSTGLVIAALVLGALGLATGIAGLMTARRRTA